MTFKAKYRPKTGLPIKQISDYLKPKTSGLFAYALPAFATFLVASSAVAGLSITHKSQS